MGAGLDRSKTVDIRCRLIIPTRPGVRSAVVTRFWSQGRVGPIAVVLVGAMSGAVSRPSDIFWESPKLEGNSYVVEYDISLIVFGVMLFRWVPGLQE